jgi:lipoprotein-releasing system ATP-binding protein
MQLRLNNLSKKYREGQEGLTVIDSLSIEFASEESVAIEGASGIGKSTLLHLLGGLDKPSSGEVYFDDLDIYSLSHEKLSEFRGKNVGFIFQFHHLLPEFSALENVYMPLLIDDVPEKEAKLLAGEILGSVGLYERQHHRPGELSGGEQQRVAIARALVAKPKIVLADEPTGNLDQKTAAEIQELLLSVCKEIGATLIVVTHNAELARSMDKTYEMLAGGSLRLIQ